MVNNNFYLIMNELFNRASKGTISGVVDYASFVDKGKSLLDLTTEELANGFLSPLMNKVQKTILDNPKYEGQYISLYKGQLNYGVLEVIMGDFYDVSKSCFDGADSIVDGETYTDQFKVEKPKDGAVRYYTNSDPWSKTVTISDTELRGAFTSPESMDMFIRKIFLDIDNSNTFHRELNRINAVNAIIKETLSSNEESDDENNAKQTFHMLTIYNKKMGTTLTEAESYYNTDYIRFVTSAIRGIEALLKKPTDKFNVLGEIVTFTPSDKMHLVINAVFDSAIRRSLVDAYNEEYGMIQGNYEIVPYWQNIDDRLRITTNTEEESETTYSAPILAFIYDDRAVGEMMQLEEVATTRNAKRRYTNYHYNFNYMYWSNLNANTVVFLND